MNIDRKIVKEPLTDVYKESGALFQAEVMTQGLQSEPLF
jgi:hypothetical protein